ncbi:MAG: DUF748 domain-containing protein [Flavobacterium sp.]|nr:DUF748 domain-containing protein [Pedobacter sp.]
MVLATFIVGAAFYLNILWKPYLSQHIKDAVSASTDSLYSISFEKLNVNVITGNATLAKLIFKPDTVVYNKLLRNGKAPKHLFNIEIDLLKLSHIHPFKVYFERKLDIKSLIIQKPRIRMIFQNSRKRNSLETEKHTAYQRLSKYLKAIKIDNISLREVNFQYIDNSRKTDELRNIKNLDIEISGLRIDSASQYDKVKLYYAEDITVKLTDYLYRTRNGMYDIEIKEFIASTKNHDAKIKGLNIIPRFSESQFSRKLKKRAERYSLRLNEVFLQDINFTAFNSERRFVAGKLTISNSNLDVFLNKETPRMPKDFTLSFPSKALSSLKLETSIDSVFFKDLRISYSEYSAQSQQKGQIFFDHIEGSITNLTNDTALKAKNNFSKIALTGLLMGRGRVNVQINFNLVDPKYAYMLNADVGNINAPLLNRIIRPLALIEIRNGSIKQMKVALSGNVTGASGSLYLKYNDLKVTLLSKEEDDLRLKKMSIASMAANVLILKDANPSVGQDLRIAKIKFIRTDTTSFVNMNWKAILGGIKESVGLDARTQQQVRAKLQKLKVEKADRAERREIRLKRRDNRREKNR